MTIYWKDKDIKIGTMQLPDHKRPVLYIQEGTFVTVDDDELNGAYFYGGKYVRCDVCYIKPVARAPQSWMYVE